MKIFLPMPFKALFNRLLFWIEARKNPGRKFAHTPILRQTWLSQKL